MTFDLLIAINMFLCCFALGTNMSANLYEQTKEIGLLRAIGLTKIRIKLLYFYEAVVLVFSSCLLGLMIGMAVGYTMMLQQKLILGVKLTFYFPWEQFLVILGISLACAFLSTFGPVSNLVQKDIAAIFRVN